MFNELMPSCLKVILLTLTAERPFWNKEGPVINVDTEYSLQTLGDMFWLCNDNTLPYLKGP